MVLADDGVCPKCGQPRADEARFCATCGQPFDEALTTAEPIVVTGDRAPRTFAMPRLGRPPSIRRLVLIVAIAILAGFAYTQIRGNPSGGPTGAPVVALPPPGTVWFGQGLDPQRFTLTGRAASFPYGSSFALVARFSRPVTGQVIIAVTADGPITLRRPLAVSGTTDLYGMTLATAELTRQPAGTVRVSFLDGGGNELASGTIAVP